MESRPVIQLDPSPLDTALEWASNLLLAIIWSVSVYAFFKLPTFIPIHFNALGQADSYGNKGTLFILPFLATILWFGLSQLNKYPHMFNYLTRITAENAKKQYMLATRLFRVLKLAIIVIFLLILLLIFMTTTGVTHGFGIWVLPLIIAILLIPTIVYIIISVKKEKHVV